MGGNFEEGIKRARAAESNNQASVGRGVGRPREQMGPPTASIRHNPKTGSGINRAPKGTRQNGV